MASSRPLFNANAAFKWQALTHNVTPMLYLKGIAASVI
jgi:hypothetical protein